MSDSVTILRTGDDSHDVYLGFWTNWTYGKIWGATITTSRQNGGLLVAFLALYVGASGTSFWRIGCFVLHRILSSTNPRDGLHNQHQALLRNTSSALDGVIQLLDMAFSWRQKAFHPYRRLIPTILFAALVYVGFGVASIFSSRVTTNTGNEVLLSGTNCGILTEENTEAYTYDQYITLLAPYETQRSIAYSTYALQCYSNTSSLGDPACQYYVKPRMPFTTIRNASCPFAKEICNDAAGNLLLDSGFLDSHHDFGVNAPKKDRFQFRMVNHCAPLVTEGYSSLHDNSNNPTIPVKRYYYGERTLNSLGDKGNFTYETQVNFSSLALEGGNSRSAPLSDYTLGHLSALWGHNSSNSDFVPIPQLRRDDADVVLFFLSAHGVRFSQVVDDPWYSAHSDTGPKIIDLATGDAMPSYVHDEPASPLACALQYQFCNPNLPESTRCEPLRGWGAYSAYPDYASMIPKLFGTGAQQNIMNWMSRVIFMSAGATPMDDLVSETGISALIARHGLQRAVQGALPSNQWQLEVESWFAASLASLQGIFVESAAGSPSEALDVFIVQPNSTESRSACRNQKILSTRFSSFSVIGITIILVIGGLLMFLDLSLERWIDWILRGRKSESLEAQYARLEWKATTTLQLQRLAYEAVGSGTWSGTTNTVPVTECGEALDIFDISDKQHPLLHSTLVAPIPNNKNQLDASQSAGSDDGRSRKSLASETVTSYASKSHVIEAECMSQCKGVEGHTITEITPSSQNTIKNLLS